MLFSKAKLPEFAKKWQPCLQDEAIALPIPLQGHPEQYLELDSVSMAIVRARARWLR